MSSLMFHDAVKVWLERKWNVNPCGETREAYTLHTAIEAKPTNTRTPLECDWLAERREWVHEERNRRLKVIVDRLG
jgi:hypothetical protein